ncbi:MAG: glycosyltransferase family 39 protein [Vicinamibacterales bacterium]
MSVAESRRRAPVSRREWAVVATVLILALALRTWRLDTASIDHYDEGVYAFSALGLSQAGGSLHPEQRNSPALHSWVTGVAFRLAGASDVVMLAVNAVLGTVTVGVLWFLARGWFGAGPAIGAAALLALNDYHVALSRSGLTDVLFGLLFVLAVGATMAALERPSAGRAALAGVAVGLAWNTKYHGWLSVVVVTSGLVPWAIGRRWTLKDYAVAVRQLAIVTAVAVACYLPWMLYLIDAFGGYGAMAKYQTSFLSRNWPGNFLRQAAQQMYFDGVLTRISLPAAAMAMAAVGPAWPASARWLGAVAALGLAGAIAGGTPLTWALTAAAIPVLLAGRSLATWTLLAWGAIFLLLTPVYNPYARLVLPFTLATVLASAYALSRAPIWEGAPRHGKPWLGVPAAAAVLILLAVGAIAADRDDPASRWRDTRSLPRAAAAIAARVEPGARVFVVGEAALAFHLELAGLDALRGFEQFDVLEQDAREQYVVTGFYTRGAPSLRDGLKRLMPRLERLGEYEFVPTDFRLLDSFRPEAARAFLRAPDDRYALTLYRYRPDVPLPAAP